MAEHDRSQDTDMGTKDGCCVSGVPLSQVPAGCTAKVCGTQLEQDEAASLRAMGLRPDCRIRVCRVGEPCIVSVLDSQGGTSRIGLSRPLADRVMVERTSP